MFSPGTPVSSTNKTDRHNITEILLKVALSSIKQTYITHKLKWTYFYLYGHKKQKTLYNTDL